MSKWLAAYNPSTFFNIDESMRMRSNTFKGRLISFPRKPTPLGIMLKMAVDAVTGIMVSAKIIEGKEVDANKKYTDVCQRQQCRC